MKRQKNRQRNNEVKTFMKRCNLRSGVTPFYKGFDNTYMEIKIQLLLPLFLQSKDVADLALVVDKGPYAYVGKTILTLEWAYVNSRRIVRPDVEWLKI